MVGQTVSRAGIGRSMATRWLVGASAAVVVLALCAAGCRTPAFKLDGGSDDLGAANLAGADTPADMLADTPADMLLVPSASCTMLPANCGSGGADNCCNSPVVGGGMFKRSYDVAIDNAYPDQTHPATVSDFRLDKYEVTVGRFRNFVNAGMGTQASPPAAGAGANPYIASSGWDTSFNSSLTANTTALIAAVKCGATTYQTGPMRRDPTTTCR